MWIVPPYPHQHHFDDSHYYPPEQFGGYQQPDHQNDTGKGQHGGMKLLNKNPQSFIPGEFQHNNGSNSHNSGNNNSGNNNNNNSSHNNHNFNSPQSSQQMQLQPQQQSQQQHQQQNGHKQHEMSQNNNSSTPNTKYKSELCKNFMQFGSCPYSGSCQFAHNEAELRVTVKPRKFRTQKCKNWTATQTCPYMHRCCFLHINENGEADIAQRMFHLYGDSHNKEHIQQQQQQNQQQQQQQQNQQNQQNNSQQNNNQNDQNNYQQVPNTTTPSYQQSIGDKSIHSQQKLNSVDPPLVLSTSTSSPTPSVSTAVAHTEQLPRVSPTTAQAIVHKISQQQQTGTKFTKQQPYPKRGANTPSVQPKQYQQSQPSTLLLDSQPYSPYNHNNNNNNNNNNQGNNGHGFVSNDSSFSTRAVLLTHSNSNNNHSYAPHNDYTLPNHNGYSPPSSSGTSTTPPMTDLNASLPPMTGVSLSQSSYHAFHDQQQQQQQQQQQHQMNTHSMMGSINHGNANNNNNNNNNNSSVPVQANLTPQQQHSVNQFEQMARQQFESSLYQFQAYNGAALSSHSNPNSNPASIGAQPQVTATTTALPHSLFPPLPLHLGAATGLLAPTATTSAHFLSVDSPSFHGPMTTSILPLDASLIEQQPFSLGHNNDLFATGSAHHVYTLSESQQHAPRLYNEQQQLQQQQQQQQQQQGAVVTTTASTPPPTLGGLFLSTPHANPHLSQTYGSSPVPIDFYMTNSASMITTNISIHQPSLQDGQNNNLGLQTNNNNNNNNNNNTNNASNAHYQAQLRALNNNNQSDLPNIFFNMSINGSLDPSSP
jgi:hypothetical protein